MKKTGRAVRERHAGTVPEGAEKGSKEGFRMDERQNGGIQFRERKRWIFFALPFTFTVYTVTEDMITVAEGFLNKKENDCYMYKVQDVELLESLPQRIFGLGTVRCYTGDTTNPTLLVQNVKNARAIKNFILEASEKARMRRRTMNMLDIGAEDETDDGT